ncbi:MAG: hypothetical protein GY849_02100 [Deltaproteobacteria bacterium]|nr:hypothetical protein [Deltaproteobacteria bacterium]
MENITEFSNGLNNLIEENKQLKSENKRLKLFLKSALAKQNDLTFIYVENIEKFCNETIILYGDKITLIWKSSTEKVDKDSIDIWNLEQKRCTYKKLIKDHQYKISTNKNG